MSFVTHLLLLLLVAAQALSILLPPPLHLTREAHLLLSRDLEVLPLPLLLLPPSLPLRPLPPLRPLLKVPTLAREEVIVVVVVVAEMLLLPPRHTGEMMKEYQNAVYVHHHDLLALEIRSKSHYKEIRKIEASAKKDVHRLPLTSRNP